MTARYLIDRARDQLVVAGSLPQRVHDRLCAGRLLLDQADALTRSGWAPIERAFALMDAPPVRGPGRQLQQRIAVRALAPTRRGTPR